MKSWFESLPEGARFFLGAVFVILIWVLPLIWSDRDDIRSRLGKQRRERKERAERNRQAEAQRLKQQEEKRKEEATRARNAAERAALIQSLRTPDGKNNYLQSLSQTLEHRNYLTVDLELLQAAFDGAAGLGIALPENIVPQLVKDLVKIYCDGSTSYHYYGGSRAYESGSYHSTNARARKNRDDASVEYKKSQLARGILILLSTGWEASEAIKNSREAVKRYIASRTMADDSAYDHAHGAANEETIVMIDGLLRSS